MVMEMQIGSTRVKSQNIFAILGLLVITLGIYQFFWYYRINREMKDVGGIFGDAALASSSPGMSLLAMFVPIANLVSMHNTAGRIRRVQAITGKGSDYSTGLHWMLAIMGVWLMYVQVALNAVWGYSLANQTTTSNSAPAREPVPV